MASKKFADILRDEQAEAEKFLSESTITALKSDISALKRARTADAKRLADLTRELQFIQTIDHNKAPAWAAPKKKIKGHHGILTLLLSDLHLDEIVDPAEIEGLGCYNREIALQRLKRVQEKTIMLAREYITGVTYDGLNLMLGGDLYSGFIHEELAETNEATLIASVEFWLDHLSSLIGGFADEFGKIHVSGVVGNHSRMSRKPRNKRRVTDNVDWLTYRLLARDFRTDPRVTFQIPESADCIVPVYDTKYLFTHGDQFRGGGGVVGPLNPIMNGANKKAKRSMLIDRPWDYMVMGHFHQLSFYKNVIINGSLKGEDEFAYIQNFEYEDAQQALWLTTPEHGITATLPVLVQDRAAEGW